VEERRAFEHLSLVAALVPDLARWPSSDRAALVGLMRAKGVASERVYARHLDHHRRLYLVLRRLAQS